MQYKSQRPPSLDRGRYYIEPSTSISPTTYSSPSMHPARVASTTEGRAPSRASRVEKANASAQKAEIYGDKSAAATSTAASNVMSKTINDDEKK